MVLNYLKKMGTIICSFWICSWFRCYIGLCKSTLQSKQTLCAPLREVSHLSIHNLILIGHFRNKNLFLVKKIQIGHYSKKMLNNKKILVTGSGGQLGKTLQKRYRRNMVLIGFFYLKKNLI